MVQSKKVFFVRKELPFDEVGRNPLAAPYSCGSGVRGDYFVYGNRVACTHVYGVFLGRALLYASVFAGRRFVDRSSLQSTSGALTVNRRGKVVSE